MWSKLTVLVVFVLLQVEDVDQMGWADEELIKDGEKNYLFLITES